MTSTPTIQDVARRSGVAAVTVSRVVNASGPVSAATRARVMAAVAELGYRPNRSARGLVRRRTASVAALVPFVTHPSAAARIRGLVDGFRAVDLPVSLFDVELPDHQHQHLLALTGDLRPEGLVVISLQLTADELDRLRDADLRPVLVDTEAEALSSVLVDDVEGGRLATRHLIDLGHRRIAFVGDREPDRFGFTSSHDRHLGYVQALADAGLPRRPSFERTVQHGKETAQAQTLALLKLDEPPTAVFAASDTQALGVLQAARELHVRVPQDLSVIGFDDLDVAEHAGLTTVHQPLVGSGRQAARLVEAEMTDPSRPPERVVMDIHLVVRGTTDQPAERELHRNQQEMAQERTRR